MEWSGIFILIRFFGYRTHYSASLPFESKVIIIVGLLRSHHIALSSVLLLFGRKGTAFFYNQNIFPCFFLEKRE